MNFDHVFFLHYVKFKFDDQTLKLVESNLSFSDYIMISSNNSVPSFKAEINQSEGKIRVSGSLTARLGPAEISRKKTRSSGDWIVQDDLKTKINQI